jgi:hypothetical protein
MMKHWLVNARGCDLVLRMDLQVIFLNADGRNTAMVSNRSYMNQLSMVMVSRTLQPPSMPLLPHIHAVWSFKAVWAPLNSSHAC